jgi:hypothetical protein
LWAWARVRSSRLIKGAVCLRRVEGGTGTGVEDGGRGISGLYVDSEAVTEEHSEPVERSVRWTAAAWKQCGGWISA